MKNPYECSVMVLKRWLRCHGTRKTGTRKTGRRKTGTRKTGTKQQLIDRVKRCLATNTGVNPTIDNGKWYELKKNLEKNLSTQKPDQFTPTQGWKVFPSFNIPSIFNYGHINLHNAKCVNIITYFWHMNKGLL